MFINISHKYKSKNFDNRKKKISFIILHYTETKNLNDAVNLLTSKKRKVSCHYLIDLDGSIYNLVDVNYRAWHAGESKWKRSEDINSRSIGIEIVNSGEGSLKKYKEKQILSLIKLLIQLKKQFKIEDNYILGHSDIAPFRKIDPGKHFPWKRLYQNSVGVWVDEKINDSPLNKMQYNTLLKNLKKIGYPYIKDNKLTQNNKKIINSFHRHHLSRLVDKFPTKTSLIKSNNLLKKIFD